tara:strand:+ start:42 stop:278 length:237 start_codon:yes stop_codon:yes gene_type:complete
MISEIIALLMFVGPDIKEHRIQTDPATGKPSMSVCLKHKREASRPPISASVSYKCIKSKAELEKNIDGSYSIKSLILE